MTDQEDPQALRNDVIQILKNLITELEAGEASFLLCYRKARTAISDTQFHTSVDTIAVLPLDEAPAYKKAIDQFLDPAIADMNYQVTVVSKQAN